MFDGHLTAAALVAGGVVGQKIAGRIVFLQPSRRLIGGLRLPVVPPVAIDLLLIHIVGLFVQGKEAGGVIAGALAGVQPLKGVDAGQRGLTVLVQYAHTGVVQTRHIPLKAGIQQLVYIFSLHLELF